MLHTDRMLTKKAEVWTSIVVAQNKEEFWAHASELAPYEYVNNHERYVIPEHKLIGY